MYASTFATVELTPTRVIAEIAGGVYVLAARYYGARDGGSRDGGVA